MPLPSRNDHLIHDAINFADRGRLQIAADVLGKETFGGSINRVAGWNRSGGLAGLLFGAGILAFLDFILGLPGELSGPLQINGWIGTERQLDRHAAESIADGPAALPTRLNNEIEARYAPVRDLLPRVARFHFFDGYGGQLFCHDCLQGNTKGNKNHFLACYPVS